MTADTVIKLIQALTSLLAILVWPAVVLYILARFGGSFRDFAANLSELTLKGAGLEATAKRRQVEAAVALGAAAAKALPADGNPEQMAEESRRIAGSIQSVARTAARRLQTAAVLWVDDHPNNNIYERRALEAFDVQFDLSPTTEDALQKITSRHYDLIISDLGRGDDKEAGLNLLDALRRRGIHTPYIIYAGPDALRVREDALRRGALASTNRGRELFETVISVLSRGTA